MTAQTRRFTVRWDETAKRVRITPDGPTQEWIEGSPAVMDAMRQAEEIIEAEAQGRRIRPEPRAGEATPAAGFDYPSIIAPRVRAVFEEVLPDEIFEVGIQA